MLHNIEPVDGSHAVRKGHMKLIYAAADSTSTKYPYWYGPDGPLNDTTCSSDTRDVSTNDIPAYNSTLDYVTPVLRAIGRGDVKPRPFVIDCGSRPTDFYTNCDYRRQYCLFNVTADPCEYRNLAHQYPDVVTELLSLIQGYNRTAVPIRNKGVDWKANPKYFGGIWSPWVNATG